MRIGIIQALVASCAASLALATNSFEDKCRGIASQLDISNGTVWFSQYVPAGTDLTFPNNNYHPEALIYTPGNFTNCLTGVQANVVREIFSPLYGLDGALVYPRMQPSSELLDLATLNATDYANAARINPGGIKTWEGDLTAFRDRGGKLLQYHGLMDSIISSNNLARYYSHVSRTINLPSKALNGFYRYFRISGIEHYRGGPGAWAIRQSSGNATLDPEGSILTAMVRWVENGTAPERIVGTKFMNNTAGLGVALRRAHCKYPTRNVYSGTGDPTQASSWRCL
ncbi:hypothetical protein W97_08001 [Coniosporium apollinis CBS 100218]|uniref:Carboxylic ester hydrolase n=1 Tax=Coniosporium apollinis (strain CBS 100218) TaxID=1168221 RepID=R7Z3S0_CONA1|nr:uncharacterized protein W97_08001 [Coniosporium apollinis CBS 100218]EON68743.1 hypothetical protein W97_08001 [Coniosporium apollinis CBS 100218]